MMFIFSWAPNTVPRATNRRISVPDAGLAMIPTDVGGEVTARSRQSRFHPRGPGIPCVLPGSWSWPAGGPHRKDLHEADPAHGAQPLSGLFEEFGFGCLSNRPYRVENTSSGFGDFLVAGPVEPHCELPGPTAGVYQMGMAVDEARCDPGICQSVDGSGAVQG